jgi:hypothetical protein
MGGLREKLRFQPRVRPVKEGLTRIRHAHAGGVRIRNFSARRNASDAKVS